MADGSRDTNGSRDTSGLMEPAKVKVEPGVENGSSEQGSLESESHYPLLLPKGVVLKLKPVANHFSRRVWRQKRSSVVKPFLTLPIIPSLHPSPSSGRVPVRSALSEVAPSKMVVQIPQLLQPETLLQPLPAGPPLGIAGAEPLTALPAVAPESRGSFPLSEPQPLLSSAPLPKVLLPSLAPSKFRKPCVKRRGARRKGAKASLCLKAAPLIHTAPVIFTVPATTVKVVSLGSGCNVLQPVNAAVAQNSPPIPITTLLVNPTSFPCPLSQPLMASSIPPLIVSGNSVNLPVPSNPEEKAPVNVDLGCPTGEGKITFPGLQPKPEPQEEQALLCVPILPKEEQSPAPVPAASMCHSDLSESSVYGWTVVKTETGRPALDLPTDVFPEPQHSPQGDVDIMVKVEPKEPGEEPSGALPEQDTTGEMSEEHAMELDTNTGFPQEQAGAASEGSGQAGTQEEEQSQSAGEGTLGEVSRTSPGSGATSCADHDGALSSSPGRPEDVASIDGQSEETPVGPETGGEKEGPEEEEEEDLDDLTQDEEDEMSSASEESVLSVPELQVRFGVGVSMGRVGGVSNVSNGILSLRSGYTVMSFDDD